MQEKLRVGIIGAGGIVTGLHLPVLLNTPEINVHWIADCDERVARQVATSFGVKTWVTSDNPPDLPECDVVLLATPVHSREPYIREFARRKVPLFSEKPFALFLEQHLKFQALYGEVPIGCAYMRRCYSAIRSLRHIVRDGWFGDLLAINYAEGGRVAKTGDAASYMDNKHTEGGGVLRDLGCHGIDTIGFVTGAKEYSGVEAEIAWDGDTDRDVRGRFRAGFAAADGTPRSCPVDFAVSWIRDTENRFSLKFQSADVSCQLGPTSTLRVESRSGVREIVLSEQTRWAETSYQAFFLEWHSFLESLRHGHAGEYSAAASVLTTGLVDAIYSAGRAR